MSKRGPCCKEGCTNQKQRASGLCQKHERERLGTEKPDYGPCCKEGCTNVKKHESGLCPKHELERLGKEKPLCCKEGCTNVKNHESGLCKKHELERLGKDNPRLCPGWREGERCSRGLLARPCPDPSGHHVYYDGLCVGCFCLAYPDDPRAVNAGKFAMFKEQTLREALQERFSNVNGKPLRWSMNRQLGNGCGRRPDHRPLIKMVDILSHDLVIENDEHSHRCYECDDERRKEHETHMALSGKKRPLVWIRFNPDEYDDPVTGKRVPSCFGREGKAQAPCIRNVCAWCTRLIKLFQVVEEFLRDFTEEWEALDPECCPASDTFLPIELFYDNVLERRGKADAVLRAYKQNAQNRKRARDDAGSSAEHANS
jgi:hypothetical protein